MRPLDEHWRPLGFRFVIVFLATVFVFVIGRINNPTPPPLGPYDEISQRLETEQRKLAEMQQQRIALPADFLRLRDAEHERTEQRQRNLVLRLKKERDAAKETMK
jgi:hypothetical protein